MSSPHWARRSAVVCRPPNEVAATTSSDARRNARHPLGRRQVERDDAGDPAHLPRRDRVRRVAGQPRPAHRRSRRVAREQRRRRAAALARLPGQPQVQGGQRPVRQPGVERAGDRRRSASRQAVTASSSSASTGSRRSRAAGRSGRSAPWCRRRPTRSAPSSSGRCPSGVAVVLSTATSAPAACAAAASGGDVARRPGPGWPASPAAPAARRRTTGTARRSAPAIDRDAELGQRAPRRTRGRCSSRRPAAPRCRRGAARASSSAGDRRLAAGEGEAVAALQLADRRLQQPPGGVVRPAVAVGAGRRPVAGSRWYGAANTGPGRNGWPGHRLGQPGVHARGCRRQSPRQRHSGLVSRLIRAVTATSRVDALVADPLDLLGDRHLDPVRAGQVADGQAALDPLGGLPGGAPAPAPASRPGPGARRRCGCATAATCRCRPGRRARPGRRRSAGRRRARTPEPGGLGQPAGDQRGLGVVAEAHRRWPCRRRAR